MATCYESHSFLCSSKIMLDTTTYLWISNHVLFSLPAPEAYILFTTDDGLMSTSLTGNTTSVPIATYRNASRSDALDFDYTSGTFFYTDGYHKNIWTLKNTSSMAKDLHFPGTPIMYHCSHPRKNISVFLYIQACADVKKQNKKKTQPLQYKTIILFYFDLHSTVLLNVYDRLSIASDSSLMYTFYYTQGSVCLFLSRYDHA